MRVQYTSGDLAKDTLEAEFWSDDDQMVALVHEEDGRWEVTFYGGTLDAKEFATQLPAALDWLTAPRRSTPDP